MNIADIISIPPYSLDKKDKELTEASFKIDDLEKKLADSDKAGAEAGEAPARGRPAGAPAVVALSPWFTVSQPA